MKTFAPEHHRFYRRLVLSLCLGTWCVVLTGLNPTAFAEPPQEESLVENASCANKWMSRAKVRIRVTVSNGLVTHHDATAQHSLGRIINAMGKKPVQVAVMQCAPGSKDRPPTLVRTPTVIYHDEEKVLHVAWNLRGEFLPLAQRRYHIYIAPEGSADWDTAQAQEGVTPAMPGDNLVPNNSFEEFIGKKAATPRGWYLTGRIDTASGHLRGESTRKAARTGERGFRTTTEGAITEGRGRSGGRATTAEFIPIVGGVPYHFSLWAHIRSATGVGLSASAWFLDADGNRLGDRIYLSSNLGEVTQTFQRFHQWKRAPKNAHFIQVSIGSWENEGVTDIDDIAIIADAMAVSQAPTLAIMALERQPSTPEILELVSGAPTRLFDFGTAYSAVAAGYEQVTSQAPFTDDSDWGWDDHTKVQGVQGGRPDSLSMDHVVPGESRFRLRAENGPYVVWLLLGDYGSTQEGPWIPPGFYKNAIQVQAEDNIRIDVDMKRDFNTLHLEPEDDATLLLRSGVNGIHQRYVEPRFKEVLFRTDVRDGILDVGCRADDHCPIAAMAVIKNGPIDAIQQALLRERKRRRESFNRSWASLVEAKTHSKPFRANASEQSLGFVPFACNSEVDIYPHTTPTRKEVNEARKGLRLRAAPGEVAALTVCTYAFVQRRAAQLSVDALIAEDGIQLSGPPPTISQVRYRATRIATDAGDARFVLRGEELHPTGKIPIVPGITRQIWITFRIPEGAEPDRYFSELSLDIGQGRRASVPINLEVLPFPLPPSPMVQGVIGTYWPYHNQVALYSDLKDHGINVLDLEIAPTVKGERGKLRLHLDELTKKIEAARKARMPIRYVLSQFMGEAAFDLTNEPRVFPGYKGHLGHRAKKAFQPAFDRVFVELLRKARAAAKKADWPTLVHHVAHDAASEGPTGLFYENHLLQLCEKAKGVCASSIHGRESLENLDGMDIVMPNFVMGLDAETWKNLKGARQDRQVWLYNTGGARYGRGLYPWAVGADGVVSETYMAVGLSGDIFDDWDSDHHVPGYVRPGPFGPISLLRWERTRTGINDSRYLTLLENQIDEAKKRGKKGKKIARKARDFLTSIRTRILQTSVNASSIKWDHSISHPFEEEGLPAIRAKLISLAIELDQAITGSR